MDFYIGQILEVEAFEPNFTRECETCGTSPTVETVANGKRWRSLAALCGACKFDDPNKADPRTWNKDNDDEN